MEKPKRSAKGAKIFSLLPKAATFSISNPPRSPGVGACAGERRSERGFSVPVVSIIPKEARHRKRTHGGEPASPKISCMGQIKHKKKAADPAKPRRRPFVYCAVGRLFHRKSRSCTAGPMFRRRVRPGDRPEEEAGQGRAQAAAAAATATRNPTPALGQVRRYASRREGLAGFDWRKAAPAKENSREEEEEDIRVPHSAPILVDGGAVAVGPKKELNLWRRRAMGPPIPLRLERK
ncbi:Uncharacterized protein AXF42_Ash006400 [Apostasia shenzhenica]|uniref:Uncharacterized protein n=1 Tax=Apostasia shenzhenica TaxID=1088818 RepID=A0A2I0AZ13_9ASPA|nr:Uncharacterized protein AXF42_Ash006400 [Apostasia shenzhenica]